LCGDEAQLSHARATAARKLHVFSYHPLQVAASAKEQARMTVVDCLDKLDFGRSERAVRATIFFIVIGNP
jgi:hypothetical protein